MKYLYKILLHNSASLHKGSVAEFYKLKWLLITFCVMLFSCKNKQTTIPPVAAIPNACFSIENGYHDFEYGNTLVDTTQKGNFFKKVSITDTTYIWSCGRGAIEKVIDTLCCNGLNNMHLDWETDEFIGLVQGCGTVCWTNTVIPVTSHKPILYLSYSAIDTLNMNTVSITDATFVVTNLRTQKSIDVPFKGKKYIKGYPLFFINNLKLVGSQLTYDIDNESNQFIAEQITIPIQPIMPK